MSSPVESQQPVVSVSAVGKSFGDHVAVKDLDMAIYPGRITVLLGPNGAGKTTAIRMITGALAPDTGKVSVFGVDPSEHGEQVRIRCGVVSANPALYERLTGWDNLVYSAKLYGINKKINPEWETTLQDAAKRFGIDHALDQMVGGYSTGMKTRLALARSILHQPELLLFDEPTSGLDPESAREVLNLIREMTNLGTSILMCTHHLVEAEGLADEIVMLEAGRSLLSGNPSEISAQYWPDHKVEITIGNAADTSKIQDAPGVLHAERMGTKLILSLVDHEVTPTVVEHLVSMGAQIKAVTPIVASLEDLYFEARKRQRETDTTTPTTPEAQVPTEAMSGGS